VKQAALAIRLPNAIGACDVSNIIHVNFKNRCRTAGPPEDDLTRFMDLLRADGLDEDDIQDVVDAIRNPAHYDAADDVIKDLVDAYFSSMTGG